MPLDHGDTSNRRMDIEEALTSCDREPIHIPGSIQPHGVLLALDDAHRVSHISLNASEFLGMSVQAHTLVGLHFAELAGPGWEQMLEELCDEPLTHPWPQDALPATLHRSAGAVLVELERDLPEPSAVRIAHRVSAAARRLEGFEGVVPYCQALTAEMRSLTGFDRVMVYRFAEDGHGAVIAEEHAVGQDPFLGLHYPASDIPTQARRLYLHTRLRVIPDRDYVPVSLFPECGPDSSQPLDLGRVGLRSVSPIHREYMRNMGVAASLVISLVIDGGLWGLIACHHRTPWHISPFLRHQCELLGQLASLAVSVRRNAGLAQLGDKAYQELPGLVEHLEQGNLETEWATRLMRLVDAAGVAVRKKEGWSLAGMTPPLAMLAPLTEWIRPQLGNRLFVSNQLPAEWPALAGHDPAVCGVLALGVVEEGPAEVLWFRGELPRLIDWGGDPRKPVDLSGPGGRLHPRGSFALWRQELRGQSAAWSAGDTGVARRLGEALLARRAARATRLEEEARRVARALEASEERYRTVVEDQTELVARYQADNTMTFVNDVCCRFFGKTREELVGHRWEPNIYPADVQHVLIEVAKLKPDNPVVLISNRLIDAAGQVRCLDWVNRAIFAADGTLVEVQAVGRDVTERKVAEERLAMAVEGTGLAIYDWDNRTGNIYYDGWESILGYDRDEVISDIAFFKALLHPDDVPAVEKAMEAHLRGETECFRDEHRLRAKNGDWVWVLSSAKVVERDEHGQPLRVAGTHLDITLRRNALAALQESEERYRFLAETIPPMVWSFAPTGELTYVSPRWLRYTGWHPEEVATRHWPECLHPDDLAATVARFEHSLKTGDPHEIEHRVRDAQGQFRWFLSQAHPMLDAQGRILQWFGTSTDIHEHRLIEIALRQSEERLNALLQQRELLLREVHHRVKNNLQVIVSMLSLQAHQFPPGPLATAFQASQDRVASMALAHESLYRTADLTKVNLETYLTHLAESIRRSHLGNGDRVRLVVDVEPVELDLDRLVPCGLILNELISNSYKHAFPDPGRGTISVTATRTPEGNLCLRVCDDGKGMPADFQPNRTDSLGLRIVHGLAGQLRGTVRHLEGPGTCTELTFPLAESRKGTAT